MQALVLFIMFGVFTAVVGGIVGASTESTASLNLRLAQEQLRQFERARIILMGQVVPDLLESPQSGDAIYFNSGHYLCSMLELRQVVTCRTEDGRLTMQDMWGRSVTGRIRRTALVDLYDTSKVNIYHAQAPVTGYALVSAGADGRIDPRLQKDIDNLTLLSSADDVTRIHAYREASSQPADDSLDDIVTVFSDRAVQQATLTKLNASLNNIAASAERTYQAKFNQYKSNLSQKYNVTFDGASSSAVTIDDNLLNDWTTDVSANKVNFGFLQSFDSLGVNADRQIIQRPNSNGYASFRLLMDMPSQQQVSFRFIKDVNNAKTGSKWEVPATVNCSPADITPCTTNHCYRRKSINCITVQGGAT